MLRVQTSPFIQEIHSPWILPEIRLFIKREDVLHVMVSGNKWRKLSKNLDQAKKAGAQTLVTFGGAYSNHIYATAAAAREAGFSSAGIIRGDELSADNFTLRSARNMGMDLIFTDRTTYRDKQRLVERFRDRWESPYFLPEGGTNCLAVEGCREIVNEEVRDMDVVAVPAGTGGTMAGIIAAMPENKKVLGFSALKGNFLENEVQRLLDECAVKSRADWEVIDDDHTGGYARVTAELLHFISEFKAENNILLDPVYTGKMMLGLKKMIQAGAFRKDTKICAIHTGGLQGWNGMKERYGIEIPE